MKNTAMENIMHQYNEGKITVEQANEALAAMGADFHLDPDKKPGWTEEELAPTCTPSGESAAALPKRPDMRRRIDLAGKTVSQETATGAFDVTYDEDGYAVHAIRV